MSSSSKNSIQEWIQQQKLRVKERSQEVVFGDDQPVEVYVKPSQIEIHRQPEHVQVENCVKFAVGDIKAKEYFEENGYVVIKSIASDIEIEYANFLFWEFVEQKSGMKKNDPSTWIDSNFRKIGSTLTGIIGGGGFGQSDFMWHLRTIPAVSTTFNILYGRDPDNSQLISSFDGGVMFRPWHHPDLISNCTQSGWYHVDQGRNLRGPQCIQGVLTLTDCNEFTGGLCFIPKSHLYHDELVDSLPTRVDGNYVPVPATFHVLNHPQIMPICQAGDMTFWDSRLIHCSSPAIATPESVNQEHLDSPLRIAGYISMTPRDWTTDEVIRIRAEAYSRHMTTSHWSHILTYSIPSHPYTSSERKNIDEANEKIRSLIGL